MMPWEHVFVGYIGYSLFAHGVYRESPTGVETLAVGLASLLPDLIDKPLAWEYGVFASGYAIGHSLLFVLPLAIGVGWIASSRGRPRIGWAFGLGIILHPIGDVVPASITEGSVQLGMLLWPLRRGGGGYEAGFVGEFRVNLAEYLRWMSRQLASGDPDRYLFIVFGVGIVGVSLWIYDGMPVARETFHALRRVALTVARSLAR